jgi:dihydrofolate reductase
MASKVALYISMSLDGYLAGPGDDISWLDAMDREGEDYGYFDFVKDVSSYIVGKRTYDVVMKLTGGEFPQADQFDCYVITRQDLPNANGVTFYNGDLRTLVERLKQENNGKIYCDGGGEVVRMLLKEDLIDEFTVAVIPVLLGDGIRLFKGGVPQRGIRLISSQQFDSGLVQLNYVRD